MKTAKEKREEYNAWNNSIRDHVIESISNSIDSAPASHKSITYHDNLTKAEKEHLEKQGYKVEPWTSMVAYFINW